MPELPEQAVVCEVLNRRVRGIPIEAVEVLPPGGLLVVRDLTHQGFVEQLTGAEFAEIRRRGKFLVFRVLRAGSAAPLFLVINPKLTGRLQLATSADKRRAKTDLIFTFGDQRQLRYFDAKTMGQVYLTPDPEIVPGFAGMGPEATEVSLTTFRERLRSYRGEIKGILTRSEFLAGIGNAYADEILWAAQLHPYRKRTQLKSDEIDRLYAAMRSTLQDAIARVREGMGESIHLEPREFFAVHLKDGEPCPRCDGMISVVTANQQITNFCRTCQPGGLIQGM